MSASGEGHNDSSKKAVALLKLKYGDSIFYQTGSVDEKKNQQSEIDCLRKALTPPKETKQSTMEEKQEEVGEEVEKELNNPKLKSVKHGFAYGPGTSKTAVMKQYALNTLRKRAKIGDTTSPTAASYSSIVSSRAPSHSWAGNIFCLLILVLIVLAPVATAVDIVAVPTATITSVAVNATTSIISTTNISTTDYTAVSTNSDIARTIASWTSLSSSIAAAAGKAVTLTLSTPFDMTGFNNSSSIYIGTAQTAITIVGNAAVFDAGGKDRFFYVKKAVALMMSNVTLQNGVRNLSPLHSRRAC
jgi:hypothetical protein